MTRTLLDNLTARAADPAAAVPLDRRAALKLFAAGAAALVAGCGRPQREMVPYVDMPEGMVAGEPLMFATALPLGGLARGVLVESREGRPIKVHGNPRHPASLGATDVFAESAVLELFDPSRSQTVLQDGQIASWPALQQALLPRLGGDGEGVAVLTGPIASPTAARQMLALSEQLPGLRWYRHDPAEGPEAAALRETFGRPLVARPRVADTRLLVSLDADPLGPGPEAIANTHGLAAARRGERRLRVLAAASTPTLTSAAADELAVLSPDRIEALALALAGEGEARDGLAQHVMAALEAAGDGGLVVGGRTLSRAALAAIHRRNAAADSPVDYLDPPTEWPGLSPGTLEALIAAMEEGSVETLIILDVNPVYDAVAAERFARALRRVSFALHAGLYENETARLAGWHAPLHHPLEDWSDLRAPDGTVSLLQPLIAPLRDSRSRHALLAMLGGAVAPDPHGLVRDTFARLTRSLGAPATGDALDAAFRAALHDGVVAGSASPSRRVQPRAAAASGSPVETKTDGFDLLLRPSPTAWLGEHVGNAWLQECPEPITKEVWGNALWMAPEDAEAEGLADGDVVALEAHGARVLVPVLAVAGQAPGTLSIALGYGRPVAGAIGSGIGVDAYKLRPTDDAWRVRGVTLTRAGEHRTVLRAQHRFDEGSREIAKTVAPGQRVAEPHDGNPPSLYPEREEGERAWGMVIDTGVCTGCNACVVACQAENNVPVVGPEEVARGRDMHWLRVDAYEGADDGAPGRVFQPVPCMHCETAPCEPVCPVEASVHDHEGLNVQVYNRCVGTRFCQANCPYKVRRFNFFDYAGDDTYGDRGEDLLKALMNPDVSVRGRGVMEKCTYCVQRISRARGEAMVEDRPIPDGAVRTACQEACPASAIVFGNLADPDAAVTGARNDQRHYALLGELGTRPRTTYLARVVDKSGGEDEA